MRIGRILLFAELFHYFPVLACLDQLLSFLRNLYLLLFQFVFSKHGQFFDNFDPVIKEDQAVNGGAWFCIKKAAATYNSLVMETWF